MRFLPYWIGGFMLLPFMLWAGMFLAFPGDKPGITDSPLTAALVAVSLPLALFHYIAARADLVAAADELFARVLDGTLQINIQQRHALADCARAHEALAARRTTGSTILLPQ